MGYNAEAQAAGRTAPRPSQTRRRGAGRPRPWLTVTLLTALALAIRLAGLGSKGLWIDEADSVYFATQPLADIFFRLCDPHPPLYYVLLKIFLRLGRSEFWVRLPSALAGAAAIPLTYALGRELERSFEAWSDRGIAILGALLMAVAPLHVWYSQEARMYALVTALGLGCVYVSVRFARRASVRNAAGYGLAACAALYTDQAAALPLLVAHALWGVLWTRRRSVRHHSKGIIAWVGLQAVVGAAFWLWWSQALFPSLFGAGKLYQMTILMLVLRQLGIHLSLTGVRRVFAGAAALAAAAGLAALALSKCRWTRRWAPSLAAAILSLFVLGTGFSAVPRLFTVKRLVVSLLPYAVLASAWAMRRLRLRRGLVLALVALSLLLCAVNVLSIPKGPWQEVVAAVQSEMDPGDVLWVDELAIPVFDYYDDVSAETHTLRATDLRGLNRMQPADGRIWLVTVTYPYRDLLDYLAPAQEAVWSADWPGASVRAYASSTGEDQPPFAITPPPSWLLAWPSPVDEACQAE